jgi:hypothetical protein
MCALGLPFNGKVTFVQADQAVPLKVLLFVLFVFIIPF